MIAGLAPYPSYRDSGVAWLGEVPVGWDVVALKTVLVSLLSGGTPDSGNVDYYSSDNSGIPWVTIADMSNSFLVSSTLSGLTEEGIKSKRIPILPKGTIIYSIYASLGKVAILDRPAATNQALLGLVPRNDRLINLFLYHWLSNIEQYLDLFSNSNTQKNLNAEIVKSLPIFIPSLSEQRAIAAFLHRETAHIDALIAKKKQLIALLNEEKQAIIHHAVTRGLEPDVPLRPSGVEWLGDVPAHWQVLPLKVICLIQTGITLGKRYADEILVEYPYLRVANVQAGHLDLSDITTIALPKNEAERTVLQPGDVLMTEGGDIDKLGRSCIWEGQITPCLHQNHIFAVRPFKDRLLPQYLTRLLGSEYARTYFLKTAKQTTNLASTNKTTIGQFPVLHPGLEEQDRILTVIEEEMRPIRHAITATQREIDLLLEFRTRLIADVVTGKLDVRGVAAGLPETTPGQTTLDAFDAPAGDEEDTWPEPGAALEDDAGIGA